MWPFRKTEKRQSGGGFSDNVISIIENQAAGKFADSASTAATEAVAGLLSRAFASADVQAAGWARDAITPSWLALQGRQLLRAGESLSAIVIDDDGVLNFDPIAFWTWESVPVHAQGIGSLEKYWRARVTSYSPTNSYSRMLPRDALVFLKWGTSAGIQYRGTSPRQWASLTSRMLANTEKSLGDEASGPNAMLIPLPIDPGEDENDEEGDSYIAGVTRSIGAAKGGALLLETTAAGYGEGMSAAPRRDWESKRLGPNPPAALVALQAQIFNQTLAASGCPPSLFTDADGTAQRESLRRFHLSTVLPLARILEHELTMRLETDVKLKFDTYALDMAGRAQAFAKLVAGGMELDRAAAISGVLAMEE